MSGFELTLVPNHDYPYVTFELYFDGGSITDPVGKEGLAYLTGQMILKGTPSHDQEQFAEAVETLGATFDVSLGREHLMIDGDVLAANVEDYLALVGQALSAPTFPQAELDRLRRQTIAELEERRDNDEDLAGHIFYQALLQPDSSARPVKGTETSLARITRDDLVAAYTQMFTLANMRIGVAGDVGRERLTALLHRHVELPAGTPPTPPDSLAADPGAVDVVLVDKPERTQTQIYAGHRALRASHPDYLALSVASTVYGGTFTARLSHEIREKRGWSYGAYSYLPGRRTNGSFVFRFYPATRDAVPALELALKMQRELIEDGVTEREVDFAKAYLVNHFPFRLQTPRQRMQEAVRVSLLGLPADSLDTYVSRVTALTADQVNAAIRKHLKHDDLLVVIVCTAGNLIDDVKALAGVGNVAVHPFDKDWQH